MQRASVRHVIDELATELPEEEEAPAQLETRQGSLEAHRSSQRPAVNAPHAPQWAANSGSAPPPLRRGNSVKRLGGQTARALEGAGGLGSDRGGNSGMPFARSNSCSGALASACGGISGMLSSRLSRSASQADLLAFAEESPARKGSSVPRRGSHRPDRPGGLLLDGTRRGPLQPRRRDKITGGADGRVELLNETLTKDSRSQRIRI